MALTQTQVSQLYVAIFNRASESEGNTYWQQTGLSASETADAMLATADAATYFGSSLDSNQAFIELIYANTLNKTINDDADGITYWVDLLEAGASRGDVVAGLVEAVSSYADSTDSVTQAAYNQFTNRVEVSDYMADTVPTAAADYATATSFSGDLVVTDEASTVTSAIYDVNTMAASDDISSSTNNIFTLVKNINETVTEITSTSTVWGDAGGTISWGAFTTMLTSIEGIDITELGTLDIDATSSIVDVNIVQSSPQADGSAGDSVLDVTYQTAAGEQFTSEMTIALEYIGFLTDLVYYTDPETGEQVSRFSTVETVTEVSAYDLTRVVLTTDQNNGATVETGFTTGSDDLIVAGQAELIHGAYIDGGAGANTLEVDMKGVYAQPLAILNVQTINVENLPNVYSSYYDLNADDNAIPVYLDTATAAAVAANAATTLVAAQASLAAATDPATIVLLTEQVRIATIADLEAKAGVAEANAVVNPNSILDLTRAIDLVDLTVTEGSGTGAVAGSLTIVGIRGDATTTLEGSFNQSVSLQYSEGLEDGINLVLNLGQVAAASVLSIAHNSATLNIDSIGAGNVLVDANLGGSTLMDLNVSGDAVLFITDSISGAFIAGHPATITTTNTAGVDLNMDGFTDEIIFDGQTDADNHFTADGASRSVLITDGNGNNEFSAENSTLVNITSGNGNNEIDTDGSTIVNITTGTGNDSITSGNNANVTINNAGGNNSINTNGSTIVSITTGEGNDTITSIGNATATIDAGNGDNTVTVEAETINVTSGTGNDTIVLSNSTNNTQGAVATNDALITIDAGTGTNTILLGTDYNVDTTAPSDGAANASLTGLTALEGSSITGENITLKVNATSDLSQASLSGIASVVMENGAILTLTQAQFTDLGAAAFDVEQDAFTDAAVLNIIVSEDTTLSDMVTLADLVPSINLSFVIADGANLTLSAEELHTYVAPNGIDVDESATNGYIDNQVTITDASLTFNAFAQENGGAGAGTINTAVTTNDITIIRSEDGYNRPSEDTLDNTWTINSDITPIIDINAADGSALSDINASAVTTLEIVGAADLNFVDSVTLGNDFVIDFSAATGTVSGLTISNFEDINDTDLNDGGGIDGSAAWGSITGNGIAGTRINLELGDGTNATETVGMPGNANGGFISTGVDTYVVTNINTTANTATIYVCDQTEDLKTLGLQGNAADTITFNQINWSTTILAQGDGYADWSNLPKVLGNPDSSNVGAIVANYFTDGAQAIVNVNNAGVDLGVTSTGTERGLDVAGLTVNNADTITINVEDGDAVINSLIGDSANSIVLTSAEDITIMGTVDTLATNAGETLDSIDASGVVGAFTLNLSTAAAANDLTVTTLAGIDAIHYSSTTALGLTVDQAIASTITSDTTVVSTLNLIDLGTQAVDLTALGANNIGTVAIVDSATTVVLDATTVLGNGVNAADSLDIDATTSDTTVEMTEVQFNQIANAAPTVSDTLGVNASTGANFVATMRITDISTDADVNMTNFDPSIAQVVVLNDTVATANTTVTGAGITLEVASGTNDLTDATLTGGDVDQVVFTADSTLTLTMAQINDIQSNFAALPGFVAGTSAFSIESGAIVTLNVTDLDGTATDLGLIEDAGINIGTVTTTDASVILNAATTLGGADELIVTSDTADNTLTMTAAQYKELADGTIKEVDNDATNVNISNVLITDLLASTTVVANAQGMDENVAEIDFTKVAVTGTQTLELADVGTAADVTMSATTILADFSITLDSQGLLANDLAGQTVRFNTGEQADGRDINVVNDGGVADNGTNVVWLFDTITGTAVAGVVDTTQYDANIGRVWMLDDLVDGANVEELFTTLDENIIIRVTTVDDLLSVSNPYDRHIEIESFVTLPAGLTFSDIDGATAPFDFIENLTIDMGGATSVGDIAVDNIIAASVNNDDEFQVLTINSILANSDTHYLLPAHFDTAINSRPDELLDVADQANTVGDISSGASRDVLANVTINTTGSVAVLATADGLGGASVGTALNVGTITFAEDGDANGTGVNADTATLLINGTSDVTIASLNTDDADIQNLIVTNTNAATVTITGASPASAVSNTETLTVNSTDIGGSITFGTVGDADKPGVFGPDLSAINTTGAGDIDFGVIAGIDATIDAILSPTGFVMNSLSTGAVTLSLGGSATIGSPELGAADAMTFSFAAGSTVAMTIASDFVVNAGGTLSITNADTLTIDAAVDLSVLDNGTTNGLTLAGTTVIDVPDGSTLTLTAAQADGMTITGAGTVEITDLELTPLADLGSIMTTDGDTGTVNAAVDTSDGADADLLPDVITLGDIGIANVTISGNGSIAGVGTMAPVDRIAGPQDLADQTTPSFTVGTNATLNLTAAQTGASTGVAATTWSIPVDGAGDVNVADINASLTANLSGIVSTGAINASVASTTAEFIGDLGTAAVSIDSGIVLEVDSAIITGLTIVDTVTNPATTGDGTLLITDVAAQAMNLSNVTAANITFDAAALVGTVTFPALRDGDVTTTPVTSAQTVTITSVQADGQTITGAADGADADTLIGGVVTIDVDETDAAAFDLTGITSGATTVTFNANYTLDALTDLGAASTASTAKTISIDTTAANVTINMTGAQANGLTMNESAGANTATVALTNLAGGEDLSNITVDEISAIVTGGTIDLSTTTGLTSIDVAASANADLTLGADQFGALDAGTNLTAVDLAELNSMTVNVDYVIGVDTFAADIDVSSDGATITGASYGIVQSKVDDNTDSVTVGAFTTNVLANATTINHTTMGSVVSADAGAAGTNGIVDNFIYSSTSAYSTAITIFASADGDKVDLSVFNDPDNTVDLVAGAFTIADNAVYFVTGAAGVADGLSASVVEINADAGAGLLDDAANVFEAYFVVADDNSSAIYHYVNNGIDDSAILDAEMTLIGTADSALIITDIIA